MGFIRYKKYKTNNLPFLPIWSFQVWFQMLYQAQKLIKTHIKMTAVSSCCFWAQEWVPCWPAPPLAYWCRCVIWGFLPCLILKSPTPNSYYVAFSHSLHWNSSWWLRLQWWIYYSHWVSSVHGQMVHHALIASSETKAAGQFCKSDAHLSV